MDEMRAVLEFWFPDGVDRDLETHQRYWTWRMRGGADTDIVDRFTETTERAARGELDHWAETARGRLALITALDQFPRSVWRGTPEAYANDPKALALALEGYDNGHYGALDSVWEKTFFMMPVGHCEGPDLLERVDRLIELGKQILEAAPEHLKPVYQFSAQQPIENRKVIAAFGRHPHRNAILGRPSTPEELAYLERGEFPHMRETGWQTAAPDQPDD